MPATDDMIAQLAGEIDEQTAFQDKLLEDAKAQGRDLTANDMELIERSRNTMAEKAKQLDPLKQAHEISQQSRQMVGELNLRSPDRPPEVEYRSAGAYVLDYWKAGLGSEEATRRIRTFDRAAAHQTTADNPGLLPEQMVGPVINFIDESRPLISFFGPRHLPSGTLQRPKITQHTAVAAQAGEKTELTSRKMIVGKVPVTSSTLGGYVNVSRQDIDWTQPQIMDLVIQDLAGQYAILTEDTFADALMTAATAETPLPTGAATAAQVSAALWAAVGNVYAATKGIGRLFQAVSPDMLGIVGPLFAPVNPTNAQSPGMSAGDFGPGTVGQISGVPVIVSAGLNAGSWLVGSTAAAEVYEDRIGSLQVVEPSVLGIQVAYAGYYGHVVIEATGLRKIAKTP